MSELPESDTKQAFIAAAVIFTAGAVVGALLMTIIMLLVWFV